MKRRSCPLIGMAREASQERAMACLSSARGSNLSIELSTEPNFRHMLTSVAPRDVRVQATAIQILDSD
jgi:hypothetical protein